MYYSTRVLLPQKLLSANVELYSFFSAMTRDEDGD